ISIEIKINHSICKLILACLLFCEGAFAIVYLVLKSLCFAWIHSLAHGNAVQVGAEVRNLNDEMEMEMEMEITKTSS
ncbi:hypothetical protein Golob_000912, partial [Gossypium lobatum]|nr:hypothetical protein [Gossypium lobatum]